MGSGYLWCQMGHQRVTAGHVYKAVRYLLLFSILPQFGIYFFVTAPILGRGAPRMVDHGTLM